MNFFKKFLLYLLIIVGSVVAIVATVLAIMYFAPGTKVLGYQYLNYNAEKSVEFNSTTAIKPTDFEAIEVNSNLTKVFFKPSNKADTVYYIHKEGLSGFVKVENSKLYVSAKVENKSFSEEVGGTKYKTLVLDVVEPQGVALSENSPIITVFIPSNLKVLSVNTEKGEIGFTTKNEEFTSNVEKFYANSTAGGNILIREPKSTKNYYLYTTKGNVTFENPEVVSANIKFTTDNGKLSLTNGDKAQLTGNLEVYSYLENKGPKLEFSKINGNVKITADYVDFSAKQVGLKENQSSLAITTNQSVINVNNIYARFTLASKIAKNKNEVTIGRLYYNKTADDHILDVGMGSITIADTVGAVGIDATSGNVTVNNAYDNVKIATTTGNIFVKFNPDAMLDGAEKEVAGSLVIDTNEGNVEIKNMRGELNVKTTSIKADLKMDVHYLDIKKNSMIVAKNRNVNITTTTSEKIQAGNTCRLLLVAGTADFGLSSGLRSQIVSGDKDFITTPEYNSQYRMGYAKSSSDGVYTNGLYDNYYGQIVVNTTGKITVSAA